MCIGSCVNICLFLVFLPVNQEAGFVFCLSGHWVAAFIWFDIFALIDITMQWIWTLDSLLHTSEECLNQN